MMVVLDGADPVAGAAAKKLASYRYSPGFGGFNNGPVPCAGLVAGFEYRTTASGAYSKNGSPGLCTTGAWETRDAAAAYLVALGSSGAYWGAGMGGDASYGHDGYWWVR
jgi:hypothetical protein